MAERSVKRNLPLSSWASAKHGIGRTTKGRRSFDSLRSLKMTEEAECVGTAWTLPGIYYIAGL